MTNKIKTVEEVTNKIYGATSMNMSEKIDVNQILTQDRKQLLDAVCGEIKCTQNIDGDVCDCCRRNYERIADLKI